MKLLLTAGGQGTKVWPFSRKDKPKQFQSIVGEESLFRYNVRILLENEFKPEDLIISTKHKYIKFIKEQAPEIPEANFIIEPDIALNRGPGEGYAFLRLSIMYPEEPFMIVQTDDWRILEENFAKMISEAEKLVRKDKKFITGGNKVNKPVMGVDYMKLGKKIDSDSELEIYNVQEFVPRQKTMEETATLLEDADICTHSNHSCWYPELMLDAYKQYRPDWYEKLMEIKGVIGTTDEESKINEIYSKMEAGSTEEVTKHVFASGYIVLLPFKWIDSGTWSSIHDYMKNGENNNFESGNTVSINTTNSVIKGHKKKLIATLGIDNLVVVDTEDALLITTIDSAGDIKLILDKLKEEGLNQYL